jgi:hypothetical protein
MIIVRNIRTLVYVALECMAENWGQIDYARSK